MIQLDVRDETSPLMSVVLGIGDSLGPTPTVDQAYDPKSKEHIRKGTYPTETQVKLEIEAVKRALEKHGVRVYHPTNLPNCNQIFTRDIGFVIGQVFVVPHILEDRSPEQEGVDWLIDQLDADQIVRVDENVRIEGGDVMPWKDHIFVGYSKKEDFDKYTVSRTNEEGVEFLRRTFPKWNVVPFELKKSDIDPYQNALHLDCCFQPVGHDMAIIFPDGFKNPSDVDFISRFFGKEKLIEITREEMYLMYSNIFSIRPDLVISEQNFDRLNNILEEKGIKVERVPYAEVAKMEGLLRCSTLPLARKY